MKASWFWPAFWPNLLSTVLAVALGIPTALWINSKATEQGEHRERVQEEQRLLQALETLDRALSLNSNKLRQTGLDLKEQRIPFDITVDRSAWDAVKFEVIQVLHDADLQQQLAFHFARLDSLARLNDMYLNLGVGIASALQDAPKVRQTLRTYLESLVSELKNESSSLSTKIKAILAEHDKAQSAIEPRADNSHNMFASFAMLGFDLTILGTCLGFLASFLLVKSYLAPRFAKQVTSTFMGQNPYQVRNLIFQRIEAIVGTVWLGIGFFFASIGTVITATSDAHTGFLHEYWTHWFVILGVTIVLLLFSLLFVSWSSRQKYVPEMVRLQKELIGKCRTYLQNGGLEAHELSRTDISDAIRGTRLKSVTGWLDQIGELIDVPRNPSENDSSYLARLEPLVQAHEQVYPSHQTIGSERAVP